VECYEVTSLIRICQSGYPKPVRPVPEATCADYKHLTDLRPVAGHPLQHQTIALALGLKNLVGDQVLFEDVPATDFGLSEFLTQDTGIAGIEDDFVDGVSEKIEKGFAQRVAEFLGGLPGALTESVQENQDFIGCDRFQLSLTKLSV
jgi:hypothetical protein